MSEKKKLGRKKAGPPDDIKEKARLYYDENMSVSEIATKYGTYAKQIERELKRAGYELRTRSSAQKLRLDLGKAEHPTEGKELSDETKIKISEKLHTAWENFSDEEMDRRRDLAREHMNNRPDKDAMIKMGQEAIKKAAVEGSILEKFMADSLNMSGYYILVHQKHVIQEKKMHLDILLPEERIAIEIDGPAHHQELWKDSDINDIKNRDEKKNNQLLLNGYSVIRVIQNQNISEYFKRASAQKVLETIDEIKACKQDKVYYVNVN